MTIVLNGTSGITTPPVSVEGSTSGTITLAAPAVAGTNTQTLVAVTGTLAPLIAGTAVASTSGTAIDFTGIPSWVERITVMFSGVSTSNADPYLVQIGTSGGVQNTGYLSYSTRLPSTTSVSSTAGYIINMASSGDIIYGGTIVLTNLSGNLWVASGTFGYTSGTMVIGGTKDLGATLDRVRITTSAGAATFDAGSINILYE
jgi:hypothetical protein